MATMIRPEISKKSKYWIDKHRHYELKHFCLQYPSWKRKYETLGIPTISSSMMEKLPGTNTPSDLTARFAINKAYYWDRIKLIERTAMEADRYLHEYILLAVTEGLSYTYLKNKLKMPCGRDMYYDRYRKFFWLLSEGRK